MRFRARSGAGPHTKAFSYYVRDASNGGGPSQHIVNIQAQKTEHYCSNAVFPRNNRPVETRLAASPMGAASPTATKARQATRVSTVGPGPGKEQLNRAERH